tara:strand:+ start:4144 stop:4398 length:255 start_codon:yes stop_codon:yes gene_type:complete
MINPKYQKLVFAFFMALIMSCLMSFVITTFNIGLSNQLIHLWLKSWAFAFFVAFPAITLVAPIATRLTMQVTKKAQSQTKPNEN